MSRVRLPLWVWLSMVRMGSAFSLCESVVAVQDLFASSVWESEACAQSARPEQKYAAIASSINWLKRIARDERRRRSLHRRPTVKLLGRLVTIAIKNLLRLRPDIAGKARFDVGFIPTIVGIH